MSFWRDGPDTRREFTIPPAPDSPFPLGLDEVIWNTDSIPSIETRDPYVPCPPLESHVLLAACQHDEFSYEVPLSTGSEHVGGAFTILLLDLLRQPERNLTETTYVGLFHTLEQQKNKGRLQEQTPYVEGNNKTRILFSTTDLGRQLLVSLNDNRTFSVAAGTIHGVDNETEFTITSGNKRFPQSLKPSRVSALSCSFNILDGMTLEDDSRAEVTKWSQPHLKVSLQEASNDPSDEQPDDYDIVVSRSQSPDGSVKLTRLDEIIPRYAESTISFPLPDAEASHYALETQTSIIINPIIRFNFNLLLKGDSDIIGKKLSFKLERLSPPLGGLGHKGNEDIVYFPFKNGEDVFTTGEFLTPRPSIKKAPKVTAAVKIPDLKHFFCFTLSIRNFQTPLFPYVFGFDPATYEIAEFYHAERTKEGPLHENRVVTIGYGTEGGNPIQFLPNEVTFFKVFVTSKYVDLRSLVQRWPFSRGTMLARPSRFVASGEFWESWIYVVQS